MGKRFEFICDVFGELLPVNSESYGFTGHLYIVNDSSYAVKRFTLNVPTKINLNFVSNIAIDSEFELNADGMWSTKRTDTYVKFFIFKNMRQLHAHQTRIYEEPETDLPTRLLDSVFTSTNDKPMPDNALKRDRAYWESVRPTPLTPKEAVIDSLLVELNRIPSFRAVIKTVEIMASGYVPTAKERSKSYFDFGPIYSTISYNAIEGVRLRVGGMTTANLSSHWFVNGYVAYGTRDNRFKYNSSIIYSFSEKEYHLFESLRHSLTFSSSYDVVTPGQHFSTAQQDNIFMSINIGNPIRHMQYLRTQKIVYEKEWANRLSLKGWFLYEDNEAVGELSYDRILADGSLSHVHKFENIQGGITLRYAPGEPYYNNRMGRESIFNLSKDAPVFVLSHAIGYMDNRYFYNRTEMSAAKRFWLSSFGHIDVALHGGVVWNKVPFPMLFTPNTNQSFILQPNSFNMMRPLEFISDQYVALFATYYLKGWILNRIPGINRLKLREVVSFSAIYGGLSAKNNPAISPTGLYALPAGTGTFGNMPYMELTVGLENILKFIRIDYVRRLTYNNVPGIQKNGVRLSFRFTL